MSLDQVLPYDLIVMHNDDLLYDRNPLFEKVEHALDLQIRWPIQRHEIDSIESVHYVTVHHVEFLFDVIIKIGLEPVFQLSVTVPGQTLF